MRAEYLGEHNWAPMNGYMIVGFEIWMTTWEGNPTLSGWDNVLKREAIYQFANFQDAVARETELINRRLLNQSFMVLPLQVKCPSGNGVTERS